MHHARPARLASFTLLGAAPPLTAQRPPRSSDTRLEARTLAHAGVTRRYLVRRPPGAPAARPLFLVLHGGGGNPAQTARSSGWNAIADRESLLVVYPEGLDGHWNDGRGVDLTPRRGTAGVDDVGFISALLDTLVASGAADARRLYVTGASNGGMMTFRLALEIGDRLAAAAPIIANLPAKLARATPVAPVPLLVINGTRDPLVPWNGGEVRGPLGARGRGVVLSTSETMAFWARAHGASATPRVEPLPDESADDGCRPERWTYGRGDVVLVALHGGGHHPPGRQGNALRMLGVKCRDVEASEEIWRFFATRSLWTRQAR